MREILFRGKRIDNGEWVEDSNTYIKDNDGVWLEDGCCDVVKVNPETIGQYTGLTDKNGKTIFEGDIVNIIYEEYLIENCVVVFGDYNVFRDEWGYRYSTCGFALKFDDGSGYTNLTRKNIYEVVGNIHDNPELLEGICQQ